MSTSDGTNEEAILDYLAIKINWNDATWILTSSFIIFTMQTGFALLQSGFVRRKNQVSMMLNTTFNPIISGSNIHCYSILFCRLFFFVYLFFQMIFTLFRFDVLAVSLWLHRRVGHFQRIYWHW